MNLYTDDNPETTIKGLGFKNELKAKETIQIVEYYFNKLEKKQKIPGYSPLNLRPKVYLSNQIENKKYYLKQKMYRVLGMSNRAKGMIHRVKNPEDILKAIKIFDKWLAQYKNKIKKV